MRCHSPRGRRLGSKNHVLVITLERFEIQLNAAAACIWPLDGVGSESVIRVQGTHKDCAMRLLLTRIGVKHDLQICENADSADGENGFGEQALFSPSIVSYID